MSFGQDMLISIKDDDWLARQRIAGKCVAKCLATMDKMIRDKIPNLSLLMLEAESSKIIEEYKCTPTFKGYKGFPGAVCLSVNKDMVHGIPSDYVLQDGDVVKFDLGATYEGAIADAASTTIYGTPKNEQHIRLVDYTIKALLNGIKAIAVGKRLGVIGYAIHKTVSSTEFGLITDYGGHGIDENKPHASPFVKNKAQPTEGVRLMPGMTLAIEPMLTIGDTMTKVQKDGWTVTANGISSHAEHTVFIHDNNVEIITEWEKL